MFPNSWQKVELPRSSSKPDATLVDLNAARVNCPDPPSDSEFAGPIRRHQHAPACAVPPEHRHPIGTGRVAHCVRGAGPRKDVLRRASSCRRRTSRYANAIGGNFWRSLYCCGPIGYQGDTMRVALPWKR